MSGSAVLRLILLPSIVFLLVDVEFGRRYGHRAAMYALQPRPVLAPALQANVVAHLVPGPIVAVTIDAVRLRHVPLHPVPARRSQFAAPARRARLGGEIWVRRAVIASEGECVGFREGERSDEEVESAREPAGTPCYPQKRCFDIALLEGFKAYWYCRQSTAGSAGEAEFNGGKSVAEVVRSEPIPMAAGRRRAGYGRQASPGASAVEVQKWRAPSGAEEERVCQRKGRSSGNASRFGGGKTGGGGIAVEVALARTELEFGTTSARRLAGRFRPQMRV